MASHEVQGYLPNDKPPLVRTLILGFQHVITMFPATVLVALLVGFNVGTVLVMSGVATIIALLIAKRVTGSYIPLYYGSSFSYIAAILAVTHAQFGQYAGAELVSLAQVGIIATGLINIIAGIIIRQSGGKAAIDRVLPPIVTGSIALVIGVALAKAALDMAASGWGIAFVTMLATIAFSVYLQQRGFWRFIPILLGAVTGYLISLLQGGIDFTPVAQAAWLQMPQFTLPAFTHPRAWEAIATIAVIAVATIPESTAHLYQISLYVDKLAEQMNKKTYQLKNLIGINLVIDGIGDMINGFFGGVAGTNYGENNSLMAITRNYSGPVLLTAGGIAIALGFIGKLAALISTIPVAVTGGLAIYLFGIIAMQGVALLIEEKVNMYDPRQLAVGAVILIIGIGGHIGFNGNLPIMLMPNTFPDGLPAIPAAAVIGIALNLLLSFQGTPAAVRDIADSGTPKLALALSASKQPAKKKKRRR